MTRDEIFQAKQKMCDWLSDPRELGKAPSKIEYVEDFVDEDEIQCIIFKFKKNLFSKWMIGIVSDSGTFSEMEEFHAETAKEDAKRCLDWLKQYWKNQAKKASGTENEEYNDQKGHFNGFILLKDKKWHREEIKRALKEKCGLELEDDGEKESEEDKEHVDALIFEKEGTRIVLGFIDCPVPNGEAEENAAFNYTWKEAVEVTKQHKAQIIVSVLGEHKDIQADAMLYVQVMAELCGMDNVLGIYSNGTVYQPQYFSAMKECIEKEIFPLPVLVWIALVRTEKGCSGYTIGMNNFGKDEMEIIDVNMNPNEVKGFLENIAEYCILQDVVLHDGETIGESAEERHKITRSAGVHLDGMTLKIEL